MRKEDYLEQNKVIPKDVNQKVQLGQLIFQWDNDPKQTWCNEVAQRHQSESLVDWSGHYKALT